MATSHRQHSLLHRWLKGAWPAYVALAVLLIAMPVAVKPRLSQFMAFWYHVPGQSFNAATAQQIQTEREQQVLQRMWIIGSAPIALLFISQLLIALLARHEDDEEQTGDSDISAAEKTLIREAEKTLIREADKKSLSDTEQTNIRDTLTDKTITRQAVAANQDDGALLIGPNGRYRVERLLASGGMGSVHKGYDTVLQRAVAIKELDVNLSSDEEQTSRFRQEALALAGLAHPYIVPVYDLLEDNNRFWIVMELLTGGDLDKRISSNPPTVKIAMNIIRAIAEGLAFAHNKGIVHRDIKPMNILLNSDGIPKLVDFGIAKLVQSQQSIVQTRDGLSLGSPTYMSPEQAAGKKDVDKRTDIYALGITFYKTLTGEVPFSGDVAEVMAQHITQQPKPMHTINSAISAELDAIVLKMLAKKPNDRFQSLEDFIVALDAIKTT